MLSVNIQSITRKSEVQNSVILNNIIFELKPKEILAIIGANGVGKTTLLNSLLLLDRNSISVQGSINLFGTQLLGASEAELTSTRKNHVKYIFQDAANCFDPLRKLKYYFNEVSQKDELDSYLNYFLLPTSDDILKKFPSQLSVGSAQRIAIIWGLLAKTPLLLLDEPTSALDAPLINLLSHKLKIWCKENNSSIILVTQNIQFAVHTASSVAILTHCGLNFDFSKQVIPIEQQLMQQNIQ
ncbi:MAG: ATP-binding cassette domain-containing protein [Melioribacteraceae bacterium]